MPAVSMAAGWEVEVTHYSDGKAVVPPELWYAALPEPGRVAGAVESAASDPLAPLAVKVKRLLGASDIAAIGLKPGQVWKWRKGAVLRELDE
jgi:hypothetical protein